MNNLGPNLVGAISALLLVLGGCAETPENQALTTETDHPHDEDELLVLDPPADYLRHLPDMGMEILDVTDLSSIGGKLYHLRIVDGAHPFHARGKHQERFPGVIVDAHHHYEHHAAKKIDKSYTARTAAKWGNVSPSCGKGMRVGVIDGPVDTKHHAFKGVKITYRSFHLKGEKISKTDHGTAVTSVISGGGRWAGVLPGAEIIAANVFHAGKNGQATGSAKSIVRAIDWMVSKKVPIINLSIGGGPNVLITQAVKHASDKGTILVASAGNYGPFSKKKSYPGAYPSVIAITAVDRFKRNARFASKGDYIEFAAPGVGIWAAVPGGGKAMSGTSFAAPIFTAYAAAAMKHRKHATTASLREFFKTHAEDKGKPGRDKYTGWGVVQLKPVC